MLESYLDAILLNDGKDFVNFSKLEYQSATLEAMPVATQQRLLMTNDKLLRSMATEGADEITKTTLTQIGRVVDANKDDYAKLTKKLKAKFGEMRKGRADVIARTELGRISSIGRLKGALEGGVTHKKWIWSNVSRDEHAAIDGQEVRIEEDFVLNNGATAPAPRMFGIPAQDVNCNCGVVYLTKSK